MPTAHLGIPPIDGLLPPARALALLFAPPARNDVDAPPAASVHCPVYLTTVHLMYDLNRCSMLTSSRLNQLFDYTHDTCPVLPRRCVLAANSIATAPATPLRKANACQTSCAHLPRSRAIASRANLPFSIGTALQFVDFPALKNKGSVRTKHIECAFKHNANTGE